VATTERAPTASDFAAFTIGGWKGAEVAVRAGVGFIRWVMVIAAIVLAARLLGLY